MQRRSDYEITLSSVEILRHDCMDHETAVRIVEEVVPEDIRRDLCLRLEEWEVAHEAAHEQALEDEAVNRYVDQIKNGEREAVPV